MYLKLTIPIFKFTFHSAQSILLHKITLALFWIFIIFGNFFKFIQLPFLSEHALFSEVILYIFSFWSLVFLKHSIKEIKELLVLGVLIFCSHLYGVILHGFYWESFLYALRLYSMIFTGYVTGKIFFLVYLTDILIFLHHIRRAYVISVIIGCIIFILFPFSNELWILLASYGISFHGDPHELRFVSCYFDPNYFAAIACIPFLFSYFIAKQTLKIKDIILSVFFLIFIVLSWSRSGIMTLGFLLFFLIIEGIRRKGFIVKNLIINSSLLLVFSSVILYFFLDELFYFLNRFFYFIEDKSALSRFNGFKLGWEWFIQRPFFGMGYYFISLHARKEVQLAALDSSLLNTIINFGFIGSCFLFSKVIKIFYNQWKQFNNIKNRHFLLFKVFKWLYIYVLIMIFFTSQFNNCLYYPFWLIPVVSFWVYLNECMEYESSFST